MAFSMSSLDEVIWNVFVALLMFCGGMALLVLLYILLAWYASRHASRDRARNNHNSSKDRQGHGLSKSDIQKLPTVVCTSNSNAHQQEENEKAEDGDDDDDEKKSSEELCVAGDLECTVCLEQFMDGDRCLVMPTCRHCFHVNCADAWLSKSTICPICRASAQPTDEEHKQVQGCSRSSNHIPDSTVIDIPS